MIRTRLWKALAVCGVAVLTAVGLTTTSAAAAGVPAGGVPADLAPLASEATSTGDIGVMHLDRVFFNELGCEFVGVSDHALAETILNKGTNQDCKTVKVRIFACNSSFTSCGYSGWSTSTKGHAKLVVPSGYVLLASQHTCGKCSGVYTINH